MTNPQSDHNPKLEELLRAAAPRFDDGFADRVIGRIGSEPTLRLELSTALWSQFRKLAPIGLAAGLALAAFNVSSADAAGQTLAEAAVGLEPQETVSWYSIEIPGWTGEVTP